MYYTCPLKIIKQLFRLSQVPILCLTDWASTFRTEIIKQIENTKEDKQYPIKMLWLDHLPAIFTVFHNQTPISVKYLEGKIKLIST